MAKLTLHVPDELVVAAKSEAASRSVSVSKLVSDFFRSFRQTDSDQEFDFPPITASLVGCLDRDGDDDKIRDQYVEFLEQKHS